MGVPDDSSRRPVAKRQRLSLKSTKTKNVPQETSPSPIKESSSSESSASISNVSSSIGFSSTSTTDVNSSSSKEEIRVPAVASLENLGNTCFMNSVMQLLRYTPGFLHNLALLYRDIQASEKVMRKKKKDDKDQNSSEDNNSKDCWKVVKNVYKVYRDLTSLETKYDEVASDDVMSMAVKPSKVLMAVRDLNPMYAGNMQHDAQEFLRCLLCYFQEAEKDVQKFYSHLPQKLSPKVNPIMQQFILSAKVNPACKVKIEKIVNEISNNPAQLNDTSDSSVALEADKVKTKLFTESENGTEMATPQKKEFNVPNVLNSGSVVDNKSDKKEGFHSKTDESQPSNESKVQDNIGKQTKGKSNRVSNRFKPYEKKLRGPKCAQTSVKKEKCKNEVSSQPCISDMFVKTYSKNKRLGMKGAVVKKSEDRFDEIVDGSADERKNAPLSDSNIALESSSKMSVEKESNNNDAAFSNQSGAESDIVSKLANNTSTQTIESAAVRSFQDAFTTFFNNAITNDSDETQSDSDSEDIVLKKKREKLVKDSPCRTPRKTKSEIYRTSPFKTSVSKSGFSSLSDSSIRSAQYKLNFNDNVNNSAEEDSACSLISSENISNSVDKGDVTTETGGDENNDNVVSATSPPMVLDPVVMLENCDHVLNEDGTAVSASYASKCLTPVKHDRGISTSGVGNYLKERHIMHSMDMSDEADIKKALVEMLNSPVKSRSKYDLIERTFQGTMMLRTRCTQCESSWERQEDFHDVSVPVRIEKSDSDDEEDEDEACGLLDLIQASTDIEKLRDGNKYQCDVCKTLVDAERSIHYDILPDILTLHLKRFSAEIENPSYITKINDHVNIPLTLPCLRYRCPELCLRPDHRYKLYGIITHAGSSLTSGHYLTYVRSLPEQSDHPVSRDLSDTSCPPYFNAVKEETENDDGLALKATGTTMPATRRNLGVQTKLPSRYNDSVISNTKVKTFQNLAATKKPNLMESLAPAQKYHGEWFECNDESVRVFDEAEFSELLDDKSGSLLGTPYLLFYHKSTLC